MSGTTQPVDLSYYLTHRDCTEAKNPRGTMPRNLGRMPFVPSGRISDCRWMSTSSGIEPNKNLAESVRFLRSLAMS